MRAMSSSDHCSRRRFVIVTSGAAVSALLAACSRGTAPTTLASTVPTQPVPIPLATSAVANTPVALTPSIAAGSAAITGISQSVGTLSTQDVFVSPLDPSWSYSHGSWARLRHPGWPTDRMAAVMSNAWIRSGNVVKGGVGRRCAIVTDSPSATLLVEGNGQSLSVSLDGGPPLRIGPLPMDGSQVASSLFADRAGTTRIELIFDDGGMNDGLLVRTGATVLPVPDPGAVQRRLVVLGNGYAAGVGASAPGVTGCAALIGERLKMEAVSQGWDRTDVDMRRAEQGIPVKDSGLDRVASDLIALAPHAVVLIYGLDTAVASTVPTWQYAYDYATLLRTIRTALPAVPVFCSGIPTCSGGISEAFLQPWNDAVRSATITVDNCPFIDATGWWGPANYYGGDGPVYIARDNLHPNDAGHRFLADKYAAAITYTNRAEPMELSVDPAPFARVFG